MFSQTMSSLNGIFSHTQSSVELIIIVVDAVRLSGINASVAGCCCSTVEKGTNANCETAEMPDTMDLCGGRPMQQVPRAYFYLPQ